MDYFDPLEHAFWTVIGYAILCGGIVGIERQFRGKPAGVRTSILVCLGTSVFIHLGVAIPGTAQIQRAFWGSSYRESDSWEQVSCSRATESYPV